MNTETLLIRSDSSESIGAGHVLRCLALAQEWKKTGGHSVFLSSSLPGHFQELFQKEGIETKSIQSLPGTSQDAKETKKIIQEMNPKYTVLDGYHFSPSYQKMIKSSPTCLGIIDDIADLDFYWADFLVNQNIYATPALYADKTSAKKLFLGSDYVLLRNDFLESRPKKMIHNQVSHILILLGGSDPHNHLLKLLKTLENLKTPKLTFDVVVGPLYSHAQSIEEWQKESGHTIILHRSPKNMIPLMQNADLAISAAGTTTWELLYEGVPTLFGFAVDHQKQNTEELERRGLTMNLGSLMQPDTQRCLTLIERLLQHPDLRKKFSKKGQTLIEGKGREKIIQGIKSS